MEFIPDNEILEFKPDTLETVRRNINLYKPGEMKAAIEILKEWIQQQPHLRKKDFSDFFIETSIVGSKGSIEKAKTQIDKFCTMRTLLPHFYGEFNLAEYTKSHDYIESFQFILDLRTANMSDFVTKVNLVELKQAITIFVHCYGLRLIGIYIISTSKLVDVFIGLLNQILKPKIMSRLHYYQDCKELLRIIGNNVLPIELEGTERSIRDIQNHWIEILSSKKHLDYVREMNLGNTDESRRPIDKLAQDYDGVPGTFRVLNVD
ncbi:uncharacterized protein LOC119835490 [Zerene cesonia]|uniref:uncharacterized protein LOC119835490 n=1 Tax=Zerene cesonia TaxID=33412 RepID=UPI0018E4EB84|nr:uncharacterized protein LOC119835490 [Zerene cesonia]